MPLHGMTSKSGHLRCSSGDGVQCTAGEARPLGLRAADTRLQTQIIFARGSAATFLLGRTPELLLRFGPAHPSCALKTGSFSARKGDVDGTQNETEPAGCFRILRIRCRHRLRNVLIRRSLNRQELGEKPAPALMIRPVPDAEKRIGARAERLCAFFCMLFSGALSDASGIQGSPLPERTRAY